MPGPGAPNLNAPRIPWARRRGVRRGPPHGAAVCRRDLCPAAKAVERVACIEKKPQINAFVRRVAKARAAPPFFGDTEQHARKEGSPVKAARSEAEKTGGGKVQELVEHMERELHISFDDAVIAFCSDMLPFFHAIQALAGFLNYEVKVKNFF